MSDKTRIEWTDATWNPVTGCTKVSEGCDHCYAETIAHRFAGTPAYPNGFAVTLRPERLDQPLRWQRPRRIFVNSMSDLFHSDVPDEYIARVFAVMALAPQHTFQVLTKRPGRMRSLLSQADFQLMVDAHMHNHGDVETEDWPLPNVWLGTSVESQKWADVRIPQLLQTPAAVRFLSCEPLLGPVDLRLSGRAPSLLRDGELFEWQRAIHWIICGGESGPHARPMHPDWARSLRDQCVAAGVAFHFKQWGEWVPESALLHRDDAPAAFLDPAGTFRPLVNCIPESAPRARGQAMTIRRVGKKTAGRELDGRTWDEYPEARS